MELDSSNDVQLFDIGRVVATPGAIEITKLNGQRMSPLIKRHQSGDWGDMHDEDKDANDAAVNGEMRVMSSYDLPDGNKVWIITEWDRSVTTLLLPSEY